MSKGQKTAKAKALPAKSKAAEAAAKIATLNRDALAEALAACKLVVESRNTIPILGHVLLVQEKSLNPIKLIVTNLDIKLEAEMPEQSKTDPFTLTMPFHQLLRIVNADKDVEVLTIETAVRKTATAGGGSIDENYSVVTCGDMRVEVGEASRPEDFPTLDIGKKTKAKHTFVAEDLWIGLGKVEHSMSVEATRYYLNGVYFDGAKDKDVRMVATDGHRLSMFKTSTLADNTFGAIIPQQVVSLLLHLLKQNKTVENVPFTFMEDKQCARCTIGPISVAFKLVDGTYPDYQRVMSNPTITKLSVNPDGLIKSIDKLLASVRAPSKHATVGGMKVAPNDTNVELSLNRPEEGKSLLTMPCSVEGKSQEIGLNPTYLRTVANLIDGDEMTIAYDDAGAPMRITDSDDPRFVETLMPMRV